MRAVYLGFLGFLGLGLVVAELLVIFRRHGLAFEELSEQQDIFGMRSAQEMPQDVRNGLEFQEREEHEDIFEVV